MTSTCDTFEINMTLVFGHIGYYRKVMKRKSEARATLKDIFSCHKLNVLRLWTEHLLKLDN